MITPLYFLLGPTAAGKSDLAMETAGKMGAEILSLDSMALYRRMDIGTAKATMADREQIPHHLLDLVEPWEDFDAARYRDFALEAVSDIHARGRKALFVGGTPFYFKVLTEGLFQGPAANPDLRKKFTDEEQEGGEGTLFRRLEKIDPDLAKGLHPRDLKRIIRALEVYELMGTPLSLMQTQWGQQKTRIAHLAAGLKPEPEYLKPRVRQRVTRMLETGLETETRDILAAGGFSRQSSAALGYAQVLAMFDGDLAREELKNQIVNRTWNFVRKQRTWFRKLEQVRWLDTEKSRDPVGTLLNFFSLDR